MNARFHFLGLEVLRFEVDFDTADPASGEALKSNPMDRVSDYFTRRFVKRRLM